MRGEPSLDILELPGLGLDVARQSLHREEALRAAGDLGEPFELPVQLGRQPNSEHFLGRHGDVGGRGGGRRVVLQPQCTCYE